MHFTAGLPSFYKFCSKYIGLSIWVPIPNQCYEYTSGYNTKLQQPDYYGFSTLTFSSYTKHLHWESFGWSFSSLNGVNIQ